MTQSLNALFSPETNPHPVDLLPFRLLCDTLSFYTLPGETGEGKTHGGCMPLQLSPEEQARFKSLAGELKGHEAEFHGGLLASLSAVHGDRDEASVGSLLKSLRSDSKENRPEKPADETLWQAMLILKLAEMFREEEREIAQGLLAVLNREAELFAAIRGEEDEDEEEKESLPELAAAPAPGGPTINLPRLARAWGRLYLSDPRAAEFSLLVTTQEELQGLLAERYENLAGKPPMPLVSLILPGHATGENEELTENFMSAREHFTRTLLEIAAGGAISAELLTQLQGAGNDLNRAALPFLHQNLPGKTWRFYAYEKTALVELFADLCGEPRQGTAAATGLFAVLS